MLYKLFLEKKKKDALVQKKSKIDFIFTTSIAILLGLFGIFTSHYNSDKFFRETGGDNAVITSIEVDNTGVHEVDNNAITDTHNEVISPAKISFTPLVMMRDLNSPTITIPTIIQADTISTNIFQGINSDLFKIDYSMDKSRQATSTYN